MHHVPTVKGKGNKNEARVAFASNMCAPRTFQLARQKKLLNVSPRATAGDNKDSSATAERLRVPGHVAPFLLHLFPGISVPSGCKIQEYKILIPCMRCALPAVELYAHKALQFVAWMAQAVSEHRPVAANGWCLAPHMLAET